MKRESSIVKNGERLEAWSDPIAELSGPGTSETFRTIKASFSPIFNLKLTVGTKAELVHGFFLKGGVTEVVQHHVCSIINAITLWLKGNLRLNRGADETFADGHSATDSLRYKRHWFHTRASGDGDGGFFILWKVHASFMMYT